jgi:hypothetical protein
VFPYLVLRTLILVLALGLNRRQPPLTGLTSNPNFGPIGTSISTSASVPGVADVNLGVGIGLDRRSKDAEISMVVLVMAVLTLLLVTYLPLTSILMPV